MIFYFLVVGIFLIFVIIMIRMRASEKKFVKELIKEYYIHNNIYDELEVIRE